MRVNQVEHFRNNWKTSVAVTQEPGTQSLLLGSCANKQDPVHLLPEYSISLPSKAADFLNMNESQV